MDESKSLALTLQVGEQTTVSARWTEPAAGAEAVWTFVYAPGAGSSLQDPFGQFASHHLAEAGIGTLCFQFPYMDAGRRAPDRPPLLAATWQAAISWARPRANRLAVGGRSMGGRVASLVVADGEPVDALVLFAYPLHPPGRPEQARTSHLSSIHVPALFCSGTRDSFASPDELQSATAEMQQVRVHILGGADHGYNVLRSSGRTRQDVWDEAVQATLDWLAALG